jgi:hypothetical protein
MKEQTADSKTRNRGEKEPAAVSAAGGSFPKNRERVGSCLLIMVLLT